MKKVPYLELWPYNEHPMMTSFDGSVGWAFDWCQVDAGSTLAGSAVFFGDWSWNIFYGHCLSSADSRRTVVSFWQKNVDNTGKPLRRLSLPSKKRGYVNWLCCLTWPDWVDWAIKPQHKQDKRGYPQNIFHIFHKNIYCGYPLEVPRRGASNGYPQNVFIEK